VSFPGVAGPPSAWPVRWPQTAGLTGSGTAQAAPRSTGSCPRSGAFGVAVQFRREHPRRLRLISTILGWGDLRDDAAVRGFVRTHPFVAFRPATTSPA